MQGNISGLVGIGLDITKSRIVEMALRESEERYRVFINSTQDMAFVKDENLRYIMINQSFIKYFERDESEIIGKTDSDIMGPEFAGNCKLSDQEALGSDNLSVSEEIIGDTVFEVHKFKVTLNTGKTGVGGYIRNITERKAAEKLVLEQSEKLKELNATKDKFFSIIAHDLRNPFNSIIGFSSILKEEARGLDVSEIIHYASVINTAAGNTMILLDNLLDWAMMQQKRIEYAPKLLVINELVRETINSVANNAEQKNIHLISEIPARALITADENMIKTVIRNLVSNAIKFTKPGGKVTLSAIEMNGEIQISVTDNGIGISSENLSNLFNITSGLSTRGTSNEKGTGLGLVLCKEFVEKHGGRIWVKSILGEGCTFTFSLPE
jgi:PAS domain S-box-containing protein